ncbi:MAG: ECF transporter S component [Clostridia bacterium]|nr:ECF transporter S component [Clostridia bacterium]
MATKLNMNKTVRLTMAAILTAVVIVFQFLGAFIKFGPFSVSLVLLPIVIGAAMCGWKTSTWLGFIFGVVVLMSGDAAAFMTINAFGTVATVLVKGAAAGLAAGLVFEAARKINKYLAVVLSALVCPVVNTGIFLIGCKLFFFEAVSEWGLAGGFDSTFSYMILGLVGVNFLFELATNIVLSPVAVRILNIKINN